MVLGLPSRRRYRLQCLQLAMGGGSGADAAPYFRIFNPIAQGQEFDPEGEYVKRCAQSSTCRRNLYMHHGKRQQ